MLLLQEIICYSIATVLYLQPSIQYSIKWVCIIATKSAEGPEAQWRAGFRKRIHNALDFLGGPNAFGKTQSRHFNAFNQTYLNDQSFRQEVGKLSPLEMEVFCI
jgi:hypothetical protein